MAQHDIKAELLGRLKHAAESNSDGILNHEVRQLIYEAMLFYLSEGREIPASLQREWAKERSLMGRKVREERELKGGEDSQSHGV
jgi:hypothetical protein